MLSYLICVMEILKFFTISIINLNIFSQNEQFEKIPESLLLKLLKTAVKGASDLDKIKMNAVRAVGNLLQLVENDFITKKEFMEISEEGLIALTKNCTIGSNMKVSEFFLVYLVK